MKKTIGIAIAVAVAMLAAGCHREERAKVIRVALQPLPLFGPVFVMKQKGWLEDELKARGIQVKWTFFPAGPPMNESFAAGEQDIGFMGDSPAIIARASGQDTRIVGISATGPRSLAVVVPARSPITSPAELKGKRVGVVKGSYAHHLLVLVLQGAHLGTDDIQLVSLAHADVATALQNGDIDAGALWEPLLTKLEDEGTVRVLQDGTGIKKGALVITATNGFATRNAELVQAFLRLYKRGEELIRDHPDEAAELVSRDVRLSPERLRKVLAKGDFDPALHADDVEELKKSEAFMRGVGITKAAVDIDAFVDDRYARAAGAR